MPVFPNPAPSSAVTRFLAAPAACLFAGCMVVGTDYTDPSAITPDTWHQSLAADLHSGSSSLESWWTRFNDPTLNRLVDTARSSNRDIAIAAERVTEAKAARGIARSQLFPSLDFGGGVSRNRSSENTGSSLAAGKTTDFWSTGLDAGWEADLFGGVRRSVEAADASAEGVEEVYRDTLVSLLAEVAYNYIQVRTLEERIRIAETNIKNQQESVGLTQDRLDAGIVPELDVSQASSNLANTKAVVPSLRNQRSIAVNRLATLIGRYPSAAESMLGKSKGIPVPSRSAGIGIPADLLRARPDIRAAERNLAAQTALIGVAEADLYPRFTLAGTFQLQALDAENLLESRSRNYSFGPSFRWNIFSAGRIQSQIAIEESRTKQAYYAYQNAVLKGVEEVENSLASVANERERLAALNDAVEASAKTVSLVTDNYREGLIDFQNVLDAQRTIFANEDSRAVSQGQIAVAYVSLYKALGGGTRMRPPKVASQDKS
ncbi:efflux transporter outer membrane subunit [Luteolibacter marinus]|uniref:efflux transporter outer membrane subunit n=1 Tax=Luteolibacter marinus TaxID=2776705 RepID=UPI0018665A62|nr:efflux transporter outer membrane subunit [Luteolibacter marinus]